MLTETVVAWKVILLCLEYFCCGVLLFNDSKKTRLILSIIIALLGCAVIAF